MTRMKNTGAAKASKGGRRPGRGLRARPRRSSATAGALGGEIVVYEAPGGAVRVDVRVEKESVWLTLGQMTALFGRDKSVIFRHLRNAFSSGEIEREASVCLNIDSWMA